MESAAASQPGLRFASAAGRWVLAATVLGSGIAFLDATVVNVALPAIARGLHATVSGLQLVVTAYSVTLAALILLAGSLGDRLGRRRVYVVGVVWFATASGICALAPNAGVLIAARTLQGIGGALLTPGSLAIIESTYVRADRPRAIGAWSALTGVAAALGPLLGGYLVEAVSWRAIFLLNLPLAAVVTVLTLRHVPESRDETAGGRLDYAGATLATVGLAAVTYALVEGPARGFGSIPVLLAAIAGVAGLALFVVVERRIKYPMLPLEIFSSRQFTAANLVTFVVYGALGGVFFLLVVTLQTSLGYSPVAAGAASLPVTALMLVLSSRSGALAQKIGPRLPLTVGPLLIAAGMLLMTRIGPGSTYVGSVLPAVVVFGLGLVAVVAPVTATTLAAAPERHAGVASGINNAVSRAAGLFAVALLPPIAGLGGRAFLEPHVLANGFHKAMLVTAGVAVLGGLLAFATISDDVLQGEEPSEQPRLQCAVAGPPTGGSTSPKRDPARPAPAARVGAS